MSMEQKISTVLNKISSEISGFIAASVVDMDSGLTLGVHAVRPDFDLGAASAYNSEIVKSKLKAITAMNLNSNLEDMLLTLSDQIHLIKLVSPTSFIYLAADKGQTNLAIVRSVVNKYTPELN
jgi:predicted regulator of Ras-like GTPase activity (Roadblock/LC7/MglB family)